MRGLVSICFFLMMLSLSVSAQIENLKFGVNKIEGSDKALAGFKHKMDSLKAGQIKKVRIVHIGDSHIEADKFTREIREELHQKYGDGGRGMIFPYSLAKTNGPTDYEAKTSATFTNNRNIDYPHKFPIGVAGITLRTVNDSGAININVGNDSINDDFSKAFIVYGASQGSEITFNNVYKKEGDSHRIAPFDTMSVNTTELKNQIDICWKVRSGFTFYGTYLENSSAGIIYSSLGINGARHLDFYQSEYFFDQLKFLHADLIIVSLGTNESVYSKYNEDEFTTNVNNFYTKLKMACPGTAVIITCPSENYLVRKKMPNKNLHVQSVNAVLRKVAKENNFAIWDLYQAMGGEGSMLEWGKLGLINPDHIHYRREGYKLQGKLFVKAFNQSFSK